MNIIFKISISNNMGIRNIYAKNSKEYVLYPNLLNTVRWPLNLNWLPITMPYMPFQPEINQDQVVVLDYLWCVATN